MKNPFSLLGRLSSRLSVCCQAEIENPLILLDFPLSDNNDNRNIKEKVNYKKVDKPD